MLVKASQHVPIYLQPFLKYSDISVASDWFSTVSWSEWEFFFYHILLSPGYAPGKIAVNVTRLERGFNDCKTTRCNLQPFQTTSPCPWTTKSLKICKDCILQIVWYVWSCDVHKFRYHHHAWGYGEEWLIDIRYYFYKVSKPFFIVTQTCWQSLRKDLVLEDPRGPFCKSLSLSSDHKSLSLSSSLKSLYLSLSSSRKSLTATLPGTWFRVTSGKKSQIANSVCFLLHY